MRESKEPTSQARSWRRILFVGDAARLGRMRGKGPLPPIMESTVDQRRNFFSITAARGIAERMSGCAYSLSIAV